MPLRLTIPKKKQESNISNSSWPDKIMKGIGFIVTMMIFITLPFIMMIKGSTYLNVAHGLNVWVALFASLTATSIVLLAYLITLKKWVNKSKISWRGVQIKFGLSFLALAGYCFFTMAYINKENAKSAKVEAEYLAIHPFLRMGVGTILILDRDMMITDLSRTHADYKDMGLPALKNSMHYVQADGYAHAMDLRTNDRSEVRNYIIKHYFNLMGFQTLRHVGTADHLHVSLKNSR